MEEIGAFGAEHTIERVEKDDRIVITREERAQAKAAAERIRTRARILEIDAFDWQASKSDSDSERP